MMPSRVRCPQRSGVSHEAAQHAARVPCPTAASRRKDVRGVRYYMLMHDVSQARPSGPRTKLYAYNMSSQLCESSAFTNL